MIHFQPSATLFSLLQGVFSDDSVFTGLKNPPQKKQFKLLLLISLTFFNVFAVDRQTLSVSAFTMTHQHPLYHRRLHKNLHIQQLTSWDISLPVCILFKYIHKYCYLTEADRGSKTTMDNGISVRCTEPALCRRLSEAAEFHGKWLLESSIQCKT